MIRKWTGKVVNKQAKVLATKPDHWRLIPGTYRAEKEKLTPTTCPLNSTHATTLICKITN